MSYQDRVDIDRLYAYIWDRDTEQLKVLTKDEFNEYKDFIEFTYYNKIGTDGRYALIGHTHSKSEITDFSHTHNKSEINDFSHTHPISEVTNLSTELDTKQDAIPIMENVLSQSVVGLTVNTYTDGLSVYVTIGGQLNGSSAIPSSGGYSMIGELSDDTYAPPYQMQSTIHSSTNLSKIALYSDGSIYMLNGNSSKTYELYCSFYYPLSSRIEEII